METEIHYTETKEHSGSIDLEVDDFAIVFKNQGGLAYIFPENSKGVSAGKVHFFMVSQIFNDTEESLTIQKRLLNMVAPHLGLE